MNLIELLNVSGSLFILAEEIQKLVIKSQIKSEIYDSLKYSIDNSIKAYDSMMYSLYGLFGANIFASQIMPYNYDSVGKEFATDFIESYDKLISEVENLVLHLKSHEISLKKISGKEWIKYEAIFHAFENGTDWRYLHEEFHHNKIVQPKRKKVKKFGKIMKDEITPITSQFDKKWLGEIDEFIKIAQDPKTVNKIEQILSEENRKKIQGYKSIIFQICS